MADIETLLRDYGRKADQAGRPATPGDVVGRVSIGAATNGPGPGSRPSRRWWTSGLLAAAASVVLIVGLVAVLDGSDDPHTVTIDPAGESDSADPADGADPVDPVDQTPAPVDDTTPAGDPAPPAGEDGPVAPALTHAPDALATHGTQMADLAAAVPGDDGAPPLPLGTVTDLPNPDRLDFLFEHCFDGCWRDAHFIDSNNARLGSGPWPADRPFHIRHGFVNAGPEPLGDGYDVVVYAYSMDAPHEVEGVALGETLRFTSDFVLRGDDDRCGPGYREQTGPASCEWFVHDFPDGLPAGRWAIWAVWQAPCAAWIDLGLTESCADPDEVMSFFSSGVDSPFDPSGGPFYTEADATRMTTEAYTAFHGFGEAPPAAESERFEPEVGASGALDTGGTPQPDLENLVAGDDDAARFPLGAVSAPAYEDRLDFLFERCGGPDSCWRDAVFRNPDDPTFTSAAGTGGGPFYVAHGFVNEGTEPLSEAFDVVVYVFPMDAPHESGVGSSGATVRYTSDYVLQVETDQCGPTYRSQNDPVKCEWFVHEFADGLPVGRHALWAVWEAPCSAWAELGFVEDCADPGEVVSYFASGVDSPWEPWPIIWDPS